MKDALPISLSLQLKSLWRIFLASIFIFKHKGVIQEIIAENLMNMYPIKVEEDKGFWSTGILNPWSIISHFKCFFETIVWTNLIASRGHDLQFYIFQFTYKLHVQFYSNFEVHITEEWYLEILIMKPFSTVLKIINFQDQIGKPKWSWFKAWWRSGSSHSFATWTEK